MADAPTPIVSGTLLSSIIDKASKYDPEPYTYDALPVEVRAGILGDVAMALHLDAAALTDDAWFYVGKAHSDPEAVAQAAMEMTATNLGYDIENILSPEYTQEIFADAVNSGALVGESGRWAEGQLEAAGQRLHDGTFDTKDRLNSVATREILKAGVMGGVMALTVGGGPVLAGAVMRGATFLRGTRPGQWVANGFGRLATSDAGAVTLGRNLTRWGSRGALGAGITYTVAGAAYASFADADELKAQQDAAVKRAELERLGYSFEDSGTAAGPEGIIAQGVPVIRDPDGKIVTLDEAYEATGLDDEELAEVPVTAPEESQAFEGQSNAPGTQDQYQQTGTAPAGIGDTEVDPAEIIAAMQVPPLTDDQIYAQDPYLGVPRDYARQTPENDLPEGFPSGVPMELYAGSRYLYGTPAYKASSVMDEIASWDYLEVLRFQDTAVAAGLINPESTVAGRQYLPGSIDQFTINALEGAMTQANVNGGRQDYWDAMDIMVEQREAAKEIYGDKEQPPTWVPPTYFAPDYATISQNVKNVFSQKLGRDPNSWEMDLLADQFRSDHRLEYETEQLAPSRQAHDRDLEAFEARGREDEMGEVEIPTPATSQDVDPYARMMENFDTEFSNEVDARQRWSDVQSKTGNLFGSLSRLGNA